MYKITDYSQVYGRVMDFNQNKTIYMHRWYPFVEGYSRDFITSILNETSKSNIICLDPFCGSGTTPLEIQKKRIKCYSFEINPFLHLVSRVKLTTSYNKSQFCKEVDILKSNLSQISDSDIDECPMPLKNFLVKNDNLSKWNFSETVYRSLVRIRLAIGKTSKPVYRNLFYVVYASKLLAVSNLYRNGKCLSYKPNWKTSHPVSEQDVSDMFIKALESYVLDDIILLESYKKETDLFTNLKYCTKGDVRKSLISKVEDNSIDLVITSPPYLNSRDYTDIYILELWMLGLVSSHNEVRELRGKTIRSHVQLNWEKTTPPKSEMLNDSLSDLNNVKDKLWNSKIPDMISGYFRDMETLFTIMKLKLKPKASIYFNIANSAYGGVEFKVDEICAELSEKAGFFCEEIRIARHLKPSGQQKNMIKDLRESVLIIRNF